MFDRALPDLVDKKLKLASTLIGGNVKRLRLEKKWDELDLSFYAYMSEMTVKRIEKGEDYNPTMKTMISLSIAFGVPVEKLIEEHCKLSESGSGQ